MSLEAKLGFTDKIDNALTIAAGKVGDLYQQVTGRPQDSLLKASMMALPVAEVCAGMAYVKYMPTSLGYIIGGAIAVMGVQEALRRRNV